MGAKRKNQRRLQNRVYGVMAHTTRYAFKGQRRLAADAGMSQAAVNRLIAGKTNPSYELVHNVVAALERHAGVQFGIRELFSFDGRYPTERVCDLVGCQGCVPDFAFNRDDSRKDEYAGLEPGQWRGDAAPKSAAHEFSTSACR